MKHDAKKAEAIFWSRVNKYGPGGCWLWTGYTNERGYGLMSTPANKNKRAHRYSWELRHGPTPSEKFCLHKCNVRRCVNPDHLYLGSYAENSRDAVQADRHARGERNGWAILTDVQVLEIRRKFKRFSARRTNLTELEAQYPGVSRASIYFAAIGKTWRHLPQESSADIGGIS